MRLMFLVLLTFAHAASAQDRASTDAAATTQESDMSSPFAVAGRFDLGFRWTDSTGNESKYFEDLNYRTGPRLFNVDLNVTPTDQGAFDVLNIAANGLGDPFQSFGVTVKQYGRFNFRFRRNESAYFYKDTLLTPQLASIDQSSGGDFHTFDFNRTNDLIDLDLMFGRRAKMFVTLNRQTRIGEATTTLDVARDEFEFDRPIDETKNDYSVGFQLSFDNASVFFDQTYRDYRSQGRTFLPGASLGENTDDLAELFFYERLLPFDFTMPQSTVKLNARPNDRLTVNAGFVISDLDGEFTEQETARGVDFRGAPLDTREVGDGSLERTTRLADIDLVYDIDSRVALIGGVRHASFDQRGEFRHAAVRQPTQTEISTQTVEVGTQVYPIATLSVTAGYRYENRDTRFVESEVVEDIVDPGHDGGLHVETTQNSIFLNGVFAPTSQINVLGEYERGDYDNPFTLVAPTSMDRVKARVRFHPSRDLSVVGTFLTRRLNNTLAGSVHPTEPRQGDPAQLHTTDVTFRVGYSRDAFSTFGSFSRRDVNNEVLNQVVTEPGFLGGLTFDVPAFYESNLNLGSGGIRIEVSESLALGTEVVAYRNRGTFGLDWEQYRFLIELPSPAGYVLNVTYQYNSLDEQDFDFDDYSAHIVTTSVGYRF